MSDFQVPSAVEIAVHADQQNVTTSAASATTLTEFTIFKELPTELRLKIWRIALTAIEPRLIELARGINPRTVQFRASPPPRILYANAESRSVALKSYEAFQAWGGAVMVNWEEDTILIRPRAYSSYFEESITTLPISGDLGEKCRNIAIHVPSNGGAENLPNFLDIFKSFRVLSNVALFIKVGGEHLDAPLSETRFIEISEEERTHAGSYFAQENAAVDRLQADDSNTIKEVTLWWIRYRVEEGTRHIIPGALTISPKDFHRVKNANTLSEPSATSSTQ